MEPVRVLQVIGAMNRAGAETVVMNLMRSIDQNKVHFDFLVHTSNRCDYDDEIEALGGTIYRIPRYNVANGPLYRAACRRFFAEHPEIQVVHGHIGSSSAIYLDEAKEAGCATVAHSHRDSSKGNSPKTRLRRALYSSLMRKVPDIADEFLACSSQAGLDRFGVGVFAGPHYHVMHNGIHLADYTCDEAAHQAAKRTLGYEGMPLIGNVARLDPEKNQAFLLEAFSLVRSAMPNARLLLVGRGSCEQDLRTRAAELDLEESVDFLGVRDDVPTILKAIDAFAFTSFVEGLPLAVVEAQASGVPTLLSDGVPAEAVVASQTVRLPLARGASAWADAIVSILNEGENRTDATAQVRAHGYDIDDVAAWMADFYVQLARRSKRWTESAR